MKKMKFFKLIPLSSYQSENWVCPDDVPNIPEPFLLLYYLYSKPHNLLPKNVFPNIFFPTRETLVATCEMFFPLIALLNHLYSLMLGTLRAYVHGLCLQHLSISLHSHYCISESINHDSVTVYRLLKHDSDIWSPKLYEHSSCLQYENSFDNFPYCKTNNFIETKSCRNKIAGI